VSKTRKIAAILVSDAVGYSRLAGADEKRILARLRTLRSDLVDLTISVHHGRVGRAQSRVRSFLGRKGLVVARADSRGRGNRRDLVPVGEDA